MIPDPVTMVMRTLFGRERAYEMILSKYCATSATCSPWKSMGKPLPITIAHHPHFFTRASTVFSPLCASKICAPDSRLMARYFSYSLLSYPSRSPHTPTAFFVEVRNLP